MLGRLILHALPKNFCGAPQQLQANELAASVCEHWSSAHPWKYSELTPFQTLVDIGWEKDHPKLDAGTQNF